MPLNIYRLRGASFLFTQQPLPFPRLWPVEAYNEGDVVCDAWSGLRSRQTTRVIPAVAT